MNNNRQFEQKWAEAKKKKAGEESDVYVPVGRKPATQRQFNLYHFFEYIGRQAEKYGSKNSLEVGCGRGTISLYLNKYLNLRVTATDISDKSVALARENFANHHGLGEIIKADAEKLPFADNSFDLAVSIGLAEHFKDYSRVYAEQYRVLRPGGVMISLNVPKKKSIQIFNDIFRYFKKISGSKLKEDYFRNADKPKDYSKAAEKVGFQKVDTFYVSSFPLFTPVGQKAEKVLADFYNFVYKLRGLVMPYPFKGSKLLAQAHFLTAKK
ncbi:MAG: class I SAM-dependent methyltransferase [Patescibacteria group bacterium]|nr:class I SAM-dependent methyltransferase [Patescibacteria group bacterium]